MKDLNKNINSSCKETDEKLSAKKTWEDPELSNLSTEKTEVGVPGPGDGPNPYS